MSEAWSRLDSFHALVEAETETETDKAVNDDRALLNRPKLAEDEGHVDHFDIHALLG